MQFDTGEAWRLAWQHERPREHAVVGEADRKVRYAAAEELVRHGRCAEEAFNDDGELGERRGRRRRLVRSHRWHERRRHSLTGKEPLQLGSEGALTDHVKPGR